jgi:hypothetical protein
VLQLRELGQLATVEMEVAKVIRARDEDTWYKIGERRMLLSCRARVKAGIDLSQMKESDIERGENSIRVKLPPPQLISFSMPPENIKVAYTEIGPFRDRFSTAETDFILEQAEKQIRRQVDSLNILPRARQGAITFVTRFFVQAGIEQVVVE